MIVNESLWIMKQQFTAPSRFARTFIKANSFFFLSGREALVDARLKSHSALQRAMLQAAETQVGSDEKYRRRQNAIQWRIIVSVGCLN